MIPSVGKISDNRNKELNSLKVLKIDDLKLINLTQNRNWSKI